MRHQFLRDTRANHAEEIPYIIFKYRSNNIHSHSMAIVTARKTYLSFIVIIIIIIIIITIFKL